MIVGAVIAAASLAYIGIGGMTAAHCEHRYHKCGRPHAACGCFFWPALGSIWPLYWLLMLTTVPYKTTLRRLKRPKLPKLPMARALEEGK